MIRVLVSMLAVLFFVNGAVAAVTTIELKHRAAADLLQPVRELLNEGEVVQAVGNTLVLVADGESLLAAKKSIALLDRQLRLLLVRLKLSAQHQVVGQDSSTAAYYGTNSMHSIATSGSRRLGNTSQSMEQSLNVLEGSEGWFEMGKEIPYKQQWSAFSGDLSGYSERIAYKAVGAGFWLRPVQVIGKTVLVDIEPQLNRLADAAEQGPQEIRFSQLRTRLQLPLGKWYPIAGNLQQHDQLSRDIISWRTAQVDPDQVFYLRIDPVEGFSP